MLGGGGGDHFDGFLRCFLGFRGSGWFLRFLFCVGLAMFSRFFRFPSSNDSLERDIAVCFSQHVQVEFPLLLCSLRC